MYALLYSCSLFVSLAEGPRPVAIVLKAQGTVTLERDKEKGRRVMPGDVLLPGDRLAVAAESELLLLFLADSHRERLKDGAKGTLGRNACEGAEKVEAEAKLSSRSLKKVREVLGDAAGVGVVRGEKSPTEARVMPLHGSFLMTDRPTFTWPARDKAQGYVVKLFDAGGAELWKAETQETGLSYPDKQKPLEFSAKYTWSVTARLPDDEEQRVVEHSNFKLLLKGEPEALAPVKKLAASTDPIDWLLAATAYEAYGVYDEALTLFEKLAEKQPDVANYQLALARYYRHAGRPDRAKEAQEKAQKLLSR